MIRTVAPLFAALFVLGAATRARGQEVPVIDGCGSPERRAALDHELSVVGLALAPRDEAAPDASSVATTLRELDASVLLVLDGDCTAHVYGVRGQAYDFAPQADVSAWAVRIAETVYALSPYAAEEPPAPERASEPAQERTRTTERRHVALGALAGPVLVSGSESVRALLSGQAALDVLSWLTLALEAGVIVPRLDIGERALSAEATQAHGLLSVRARLWTRESFVLRAFAGAGPAWITARGTAAPPQRNRERATWTAALSAGFELVYLATTHLGLSCAPTLSTLAPRVDVQLGSSHTQTLGRVQAALLVGAFVRF